MPLPPVRPDSFDKVNFVIDAWTQGCDAPWYIYVETMKPAALNAFITLITFGWDDVLRGYFRPRGLYKRRTAKRKGRWAKALPRFPELGNTLGKQLPMADQVRGTKWHWLGKTLWRIDGGMEAIRFFWLVAAITEDFAFEWTSLLYESYWCQEPARGSFSFRTGGPYHLHPGTWKTIPFGIKDYENAPSDWILLTGTPGPNGGTVAGAVDIATWPGLPPPTAVGVRLVDAATGDVLTQNGPSPPDPSGLSSIPVSTKITPSNWFRVQAYCEGQIAAYGPGCVLGHDAGPP